MENIIQRRFIFGDEWLYFKIYSGPKTLELILIQELYFIVTELHRMQMIDKFFFIRYSDPDLHLRVRFHLIDNKHMLIITQMLLQKLKFYVDNNLVWNIAIDTYNRELERYGNHIISEVESLFSYNSFSIICFLMEIQKTEDDSIRWLWGMKFVDLFLDKFGLSLDDKINFYANSKSAYSVEFGMDKLLKIQLDKLYRDKKLLIENTVDLNNDIVGINHIKYFLNYSESSIKRIVEQSQNNTWEKEKLLSSLLHMHFNRLFRTEQRVYEFILYYFFYKFYQSKVQRNSILN